VPASFFHDELDLLRKDLQFVVGDGGGRFFEGGEIVFGLIGSAGEADVAVGGVGINDDFLIWRENDPGRRAGLGVLSEDGLAIGHVFPIDDGDDVIFADDLLHHGLVVEFVKHPAPGAFGIAGFEEDELGFFGGLLAGGGEDVAGCGGGVHWLWFGGGSADQCREENKDGGKGGG